MTLPGNTASFKMPSESGENKLESGNMPVFLLFCRMHGVLDVNFHTCAQCTRDRCATAS